MPEPTTSPQTLTDYTIRLKADMAAAKFPETAWHTSTPRQEIPESLRKATYVFVRHGARRVPLTRPYDGPFRVLERGEKFFRIQAGAKEQVISVDRLKPAFGFADPAPAPASEEKRKTTAKAKAGETLNPRAEIFVPGKQPKEGAIPSREAEEGEMTTVKSRAGRPLRPPVRFGA